MIVYLSSPLKVALPSVTWVEHLQYSAAYLIRMEDKIHDMGLRLLQVLAHCLYDQKGAIEVSRIAQSNTTPSTKPKMQFNDRYLHVQLSSLCAYFSICDSSCNCTHILPQCTCTM